MNERMNKLKDYKKKKKKEVINISMHNSTQAFHKK